VVSRIAGLCRKIHRLIDVNLGIRISGSILGLCIVSNAFGLDPGKHVSQYGHTSWRVQDGFLPGEPTAIAQTGDGYIWIGTYSGLLRFDGVKFVRFTVTSGESLRNPLITSLFADRDGSLWIGTGADLEHWQDGHLTHFPQQPGFAFGYVQKIFRSREGSIWIARDPTAYDTLGVVCSLQGDSLQCFNQSDGVVPTMGFEAMEDADGSFWLHDDTSLYHWDPKTHRALSGSIKDVAAFHGFQRMILDGEGTVLMALAQSGSRPGVARARNGQMEPYKAGSFDGRQFAAASIFRDSKGSLWIATDTDGLYRVTGTRLDHYGTADGLSSATAGGFFEDREGNVWAFTKEGIDRFRDMAVSSYSAREGLSSSTVSSVLAASDGTVWINNGTSLDALHPNGTVTSFRADKGLPGQSVSSMTEDRNNRLWVGIDHDLYIFDGHAFTKLRKPNGQSTGSIKSAVTDSDGDVWAISRSPPPFGSLLHFSGDSLKEEISHDTLPFAKATHLAADPRGGIWLPLEGERVAHWSRGTAEIINLHQAADSVSAPTETGLVVRPDGSVYMSSTAGLKVIRNGQARTLSIDQGLPCATIWAMTGTDDALWLYAVCGAIALRYSEVERWWGDPSVHPQTQVLDSLDGIQASASSVLPRSAHSADGRVWFANDAIMQMIDPRAIPPPAPLPPVLIEQLAADSKTFPLSREIVLPPLTKDVQIDYASPSFATPQRVHFRYKLDGLEEKWVDSGNRRQALFSNLRPGAYRFHVSATTGNVPWSDAESAITFRVPPAFYQTIWFRSLCVAAVLLAMFILYRYRVDTVKRNLRARLQVRLDERERIARDLHDTLFQNIQGVLLTIDNSTNKLDEGNSIRGELKDALRLSDAVMAESREQILELRAEDIERKSLGQALTQVGAGLGKLYSSSFRVVELGSSDYLHPVVFEEVLQICREALFNAFQHAQATSIEVEILFARDFSVRITDNGVGIDEQVLQDGKPGHFGLKGMTERAKKLGAKLTIRSNPKAGTEIELSMPRSVASDSRRVARRWPWSRG